MSYPPPSHYVPDVPLPDEDRPVTRNHEAYARQFLHGAELRLARLKENLDAGQLRSARSDAALIVGYMRGALSQLSYAHRDAQERFSRADS